MLITTLIATIIHMNIGFELPEALLRGFGSACIIGGIGLILYITIILIVNIICEKD